MLSGVTSRDDSAWRLRADLLSTKALLWVAGAGHGGEPKPEVHLYLYDRYWRLAQHHEVRGHRRKATRLRAKAEAHYRLSGDDGPPYAAAVAQPIPRPPLFTNAVGTEHDEPPGGTA